MSTSFDLKAFRQILLKAGIVPLVTDGRMPGRVYLTFLERGTITLKKMKALKSDATATWTELLKQTIAEKVKKLSVSEAEQYVLLRQYDDNLKTEKTVIKLFTREVRCKIHCV